MRQKSVKLTIGIDVKKWRRKHKEHQSGSGEHDSRPNRERTRERQENSWKKEIE